MNKLIAIFGTNARCGFGIRIARCCWAVALASSALVSRGAAQPAAPVRTHSDGSNSRAAPELSGAGLLEEVWPGHPGWLAMLADIAIKGDRLQGTDGWFRNDRPQTRFDWQSARSAWDKDGNGSVSRSEFPGTDVDFARLDRVHDAVLLPSDFDFSTKSPSLAPGSLLFSRADRDGNGRVTRAELEAFFRATDREGLGFVSQGDLQEALDSPPPLLRGTPGGPNGPTRLTLLKSFFRGEFGGMLPGPALNERAPDFMLKTPDGKSDVTLSTIIGRKPVVLVFGNYTCRPFRGQGGTLEKLHTRYKDRATFLAVYVREAHPTDGWRMEINDVLGVAVRQPRTYAERAGVAQVCASTLGFSFPVLVDTLDDAVNNQYCGIPSRLYLVDSLGRIAYKSGRGPFGFKPAELEQSLIMLLELDASVASPDRRESPRTAESRGARNRSKSESDKSSN
jgi:Iodothyronine deiodinase/EF hand